MERYTKNPDGIPQLSDAEVGALRDIEDTIDERLAASGGQCAEMTLGELDPINAHMTPMALRALVKMYEELGFRFTVHITRTQ